MIIYPEIDLQNGRAVSLVRGQMDQPKVHDIDPVDAARQFVEQGAQRLQVIDLDAVAGSGSNRDIIEQIVRLGPQVQLGGGIRDMEAISDWFDLGVTRVIIGTAAVLQPGFLIEAANRYPDQIVLAVDVRDNRVLSHGWTESSIWEPLAFIEQFSHLPLGAIILTDVGREAEDPVEAFALTTDIAHKTRFPIISSGLVSSIDDISMLKYLPNIRGAIAGRALFNGKVDLAEAIEIAERIEIAADFQ